MRAAQKNEDHRVNCKLGKQALIPYKNHITTLTSCDSLIDGVALSFRRMDSTNAVIRGAKKSRTIAFATVKY
jgi:hypothetical protein